MIEVVVGADDLARLPYGTAVLDTAGIVRMKRGSDSIMGYGWTSAGKSPLSDKDLADGKPMLVLWNPERPQVLVQALLDALVLLDPSSLPLPDTRDLIRDYTMGGPGQARLLAQTCVEPDELDALAVADFLMCYSKMKR